MAWNMLNPRIKASHRIPGCMKKLFERFIEVVGITAGLTPEDS